jgi:hypothetical protein
MFESPPQMSGPLDPAKREAASSWHIGLAHAYPRQGDRGKARAAYQDFLTLWKDADPDIPVLKEAKAE